MTAGGRVCGRLLIGGEWQPGTGPPLDVLDKFTGAVIGTVECAGREQVDAAVAAARRSFEQSPLDPQERYVSLQATARLIGERRDELAALIIAEGGLPITDALTEVARAVQTFIVSAEEAKRLVGEMVPIEAAPGQRAPHGVHDPRAARRRVRHHGVQLAAQHGLPQGRAGARVGQRGRDEAAGVAPLTPSRLFELLLEAGLPPGHVNAACTGEAPTSGSGWSRTATSISIRSPAARASAS